MSLFPASYSKLSTYETCPDKAKYRYILNIQEEKGPAAQRGTDLHASAENYLLGNKTSVRKELTSIIPALRETKKNKPVIEHKIALTRGLEKVVDWKSDKAWFRLVLDAAYAVEQTLHIQEWKSGKMYDDHVDQRQLYAIGGLAQWPLVEGAVVTTHYIDLKNTVDVRVDRQRATLLTWHFNERLEAMERDQRFGPRPGIYCRWCPYSRYKGGPCRVG